MAAYAATVTLAQPTVKKLSTGLGVLRGSIDLTNYNSTRAAITAITSRFKGTPTVIVGACTDNGYAVSWETDSLKAFYINEGEDGNAQAAGASTEVANDVDVGAVPFVAFGVAP